MKAIYLYLDLVIDVLARSYGVFLRTRPNIEQRQDLRTEGLDDSEVSSGESVFTEIPS